MAEKEDSSSDASPRPRRSTRTAAKAPAKIPVIVAAQSTSGKRKAPEVKDPAEKLEYLLTNSKSRLTKLEIANIINYHTFLDLSEEFQSRLCVLLPPTAFSTYESSVGAFHPDLVGQTSEGASAQHKAASEGMDVDPDSLHLLQTPASFDPMFFTSPFFLSAARTFQDHLYSSWLGKKASDDLERFMDGARDGSLHADWKDEVWEREHQAPFRANSKGLDLTDLAKRGLLKEGDVLAYKRAFLNAVVEKDLLVDTISAPSHAVTFALMPGTQRALGASLLVGAADKQEGDGEKVLSMENIVDPVALERGILDVDGRVGYGEKYEQDCAACPAPTTPTGAPSEQLRNLIAVRAWKAFTVWRWNEETKEVMGFGTETMQERGGRVKIATLFYLRGC